MHYLDDAIWLLLKYEVTLTLMNCCYDNILKASKTLSNTYNSPQVTGTECHWNNPISIIHQTPRGRQPKEQDIVTRGPRMASTHSSLPDPSPHHPTPSSLFLKSPLQNWTIRIAVNVNWMLAKDITAQEKCRARVGRKGKKISSKSLNTWASLTSAPKPGLHPCEHKLASLFWGSR